MNFLNKLFGKNDKVKSYRSRDNISIETDERYDASMSGDFNRMLKHLYEKGDPIDTHFLYLNLIRSLYSRRKEPDARTLFKKLAIEHIEKFDIIRGPLLKDMGVLSQVLTFQYLATVYTEDNEYEKAIAVCEKAFSFGLNDGTKSSYEGRINRIKKKMQ